MAHYTNSISLLCGTITDDVQIYASTWCLCVCVCVCERERERENNSCLNTVYLAQNPKYNALEKIAFPLVYHYLTTYGVSHMACDQGK